MELLSETITVEEAAHSGPFAARPPLDDLGWRGDAGHRIRHKSLVLPLPQPKQPLLRPACTSTP